jgi:hypothetical protein
MKKKTKAFDCIEMKRRIQARVYEETKDMDYAQLAEYYRRNIADSEFASFLDRPASGVPESMTARPVTRP